MNWQDRTTLLIGEKYVEKLKNSHILIVGLGGVGGYAVEQLVRAGIGEITIVDNDTISCTNINRQIIAKHSTINTLKTTAIETRMLDINPQLNINKHTQFVNEENIDDLFKINYDYVVDAIDTLSPKVQLIYKTLQQGIPLVSSMGSGGKLNPEMIKITDISKTYNCKLARTVRKRLHKLGIKKGFKTVFSPEDINKNAVSLEEAQNKVSNVGTISYIPSIFGCFLASIVINHLINN